MKTVVLASLFPFLAQVSAQVSALLGDASPEQVCAELVHAGIGVRGFSVAAPSLEDLFVGLTGEGFDVDG